jgi:hypothetical protein
MAKPKENKKKIRSPQKLLHSHHETKAKKKVMRKEGKRSSKTEKG